MSLFNKDHLKGRVKFLKYRAKKYWYITDTGIKFWLTEDEVRRMKKARTTAKCFSPFILRTLAEQDHLG